MEHELLKMTRPMGVPIHDTATAHHPLAETPKMTAPVGIPLSMTVHPEPLSHEEIPMHTLPVGVPLDSFLH